MLVILTSCSLATDFDSESVLPVVTATQTTQPVTPTADPTNTAVPTPLPSAVPPTDEPLPTDTAPAISAEADLTFINDAVYLYPVPQLYQGDLVTFQFVANMPQIVDPSSVLVHIYVDEELVVQDRMGRRNLAGNPIGLFTWAWDTGAVPGERTVRFVLDPYDQIIIGDENPNNNELVKTVEVSPKKDRPRNETDATWVSQDTIYTTIHVISGTAAHRDLQELAETTDQAFTDTITKLGVTPNRRYDVYFIDRIIGQGGYAGSSMVVSYLDRNYAGGGLYEVLVHEAVHLMDQQFAPRDMIFLREAVAVWASGGHYKQENLHTRAAALLSTDMYVPLTTLINDFYPVQHEVGYLQAAALINYLVDQYGWEQVRAFYGSVSLEGYNSPAAALDAGLQAHFGKTLVQVEQEWLTFLSQQPVQATDVSDLVTTIEFYDTMRAYQQAYDPTAHFLTAWLPSTLEMRQRNIVADVMRRPASEINLVLETMLNAADVALRQGNYQQATVLIDSVQRVIATDSIIDPLAASYLDIVRQATAVGYTVEQIDLTGNQAIAYVTSIYRDYLTPINFTRTQNAWIMLN